MARNLHPLFQEWKQTSVLGSGRARVEGRRERQGLPEKKGRFDGRRITVARYALLMPPTSPPFNPGALMKDTEPVSHCFLTKQGRQRLSAASQPHGTTPNFSMGSEAQLAKNPHGRTSQKSQSLSAKEPTASAAHGVVSLWAPKQC